MKTTLHLQRYVGAALAALLLSACQGHRPAADTVVTGDSSSPLESAVKAARRAAPSSLPLMTTPGAWLRPPKGPLFEPMDTLDPRNVMVYVYRPQTSWEDQELQAPSFFINGSKVFGLKSGSYTWVELHAGTFNFYAKRPLSILFIKKIFQLDLKLDGGDTYYLRYSEDAPFDYAGEGLDAREYMNDGYLQQVPESVALAEIASLKLDQQGVYFESSRNLQPRWAPFEAFRRTGVDEDGSAAPPAGSDAIDGPPATGWRRWLDRLNPF